MVYVIQNCWQFASRIRTKLCVQWKTPDDGHRNCPKHVDFYSKNKFEKLVHLVGFIIRIYHEARSPEHRIIILHQHISTTPMTFFRMPGNNNTFNTRYLIDDLWSGRNMLVRYNNMWWKILINVRTLFYDTSIKHSLLHGHGTYKRK